MEGEELRQRRGIQRNEGRTDDNERSKMAVKPIKGASVAFRAFALLCVISSALILVQQSLLPYDCPPCDVKDTATKRSRETTGSSQKTTPSASPKATYKLECDFYALHPDTRSALKRAKSLQCQQQIADVACRDLNETLYPLKVEHMCPREVDEASVDRYVGCYQDGEAYADRTLVGHFHFFPDSNSPQRCLEECKKAGFTHAGVEMGAECFCDKSAPPDDRKVPESNCNMTCPGDPKAKCGGNHALSIYQTGIKPIPHHTVSMNATGLKPVRILYLFIVSGRSARQVKRLFRRLYDEQDYFFIHVSKGSDLLYRELSSLPDRFPNVRMMRDRRQCAWGGTSILQMYLAALSELLKMTDWHWDYYINLSAESVYPVKTKQKLRDYLTANRGASFLLHNWYPQIQWMNTQGVMRTFVECDAHVWRLGVRRMQEGVMYEGGADWLCLHRDFADYAVNGGDSMISGLREYYKHSLLAAESFFHIALHNSPFCRTSVNNNLQWGYWDYSRGCAKQQKMVVDWFGCSPNDVRVEDLGWLTNLSDDLFFVRKFEPIVSQFALDFVDHWLDGFDMREDPYSFPIFPGRFSDWLNVYHHLDSSSPKKELVSFGLVAAQRNLDLNFGRGPYKVKELKEITVYQDRDLLQGILVRYTAEGRSEVELEARVHPKVMPNTNEVADPKISSFVGSEHDPKESMFRNKVGVLGPTSDPVLVVRADEVTNRTVDYDVLFFDPAGDIFAVESVKLEAGAGTLKNEPFAPFDRNAPFVRPVLPKPLRPGVWTVVVVDTYTNPWPQTVIQLPFLVMPIVQEEDASVDYPPPPSPWVFSTFHSHLAVANLSRIAEENQRKRGDDLFRWATDLVDEFYYFTDTCKVSEDASLPGDWPLCKDATWSSLSSDPKSEVGEVPKSGRFVD